MVKPKSGNEKKTPRSKSHWEVAFGHFNTIARGFAEGGTTSSTMKRYARGPTLNRIGVVISTSHLKVKYPLDDGVLIGTITANQELARKCHEESLKNQRKWYGDQTGHQVNVLNLNPRKDFEEWRQTSTKDVKEKAMAERTMYLFDDVTPLSQDNSSGKQFPSWLFEWTTSLWPHHPLQIEGDIELVFDVETWHPKERSDHQRNL
ncbi:hypothetical protein JHK84_045370 [Glycine max]|nr:hypothetical protein JHK84_045370 [Glycine max]